MTKKIFVFDLDNTLVATNMANNESYREAISSVMGYACEIKKKRLTRKDLLTLLPDISEKKIKQIIAEKEKLYKKHLHKTKLNMQLKKILVLLNECGNTTILMTASHKKRAECVCGYHSLSQYFTYKYYKEDFPHGDKYRYLQKMDISLDSVVLFENELSEIKRAIKYGIVYNQIISVKS